MPKNLIQHIEWTTRDAARLKAFFREIFDWNFLDAMPGYTLIEGVGGVFEAPDPQMPIVITPYVNVADLRATEQKAILAGGRIHKSRQEVPGRGWYSILSDPDGTLLGLWQAMPAPAASGGAARKAPGEPAKKAIRKAAKKSARKVAKTTKVAKKAARKPTRR